MSQLIRKVNPPTLPDAPSLGYSQITVCDPGKLVFISGQVAWTPDGAAVPESLIHQADIAMGNVVKALAAVNATVENITSIRMYIVNPTHEEMYEPVPVLQKYLGETLPTFTLLGVSALGGEGLRVEIEVTAVV